MVLGLSRMQPNSARQPLDSNPEPISSRDQHWLAQRGAVLFEASGAVMGGFPGFADQGGELDGVDIRISDRFLLVDEGKPHGFGIPIQWLDGALLAPLAERDDADLRVLYSDGALPRSFTLRFRPNRLAMRGGKRAERAQDALFAAGLSGAATIAPLDAAEFVLPWERTHDFDDEPVIWTGHAAAPIRVGEELAPSEVWLSTESMIWGSSEGSGLNRLSVAAICDFATTRLKDRLGTPAIYLGVTSDRFGRYEVPFVFNQQETPDRNFRERGDFLAGLRSRAIPEGAVAPLWQPWRIDLHPATRREEPISEPDRIAPTPETPGVRARLESWLPKLQTVVGRGFSLPTVEEEQAGVIAFETHASPDMSPTEPIRFDPRIASLRSLAEEPIAVASPADDTATSTRAPVFDLAEEATAAMIDSPLAIATEDRTTLAIETDPLDVVDSGDSGDPERTDPIASAELPDAPVTAVGQFENAALAVVADAIRGIEVRLETGLLDPLAPWSPLQIERDAALAELREAVAAKTIKKRELRAQTIRLIDLHDAGIRLRSVVDLYDRGRLDNAELGSLRIKLLARVVLAPAATPFAARAGETVAPVETFPGV